VQIKKKKRDLPTSSEELGVHKSSNMFDSLRIDSINEYLLNHKLYQTFCGNDKQKKLSTELETIKSWKFVANFFIFLLETRTGSTLKQIKRIRDSEITQF